MCMSYLQLRSKVFFRGIRLIIDLDGCHFKTSIGRQLLCVIAMDENDNMFLVALGVIDIESKDSWIWLLKLSVNNFGQDECLCRFLPLTVNSWFISHM